MKRFATAALSLALISIGLVGCDEKATTKTESKTETKVTTPTGSKTTTHETDVKDTTKEHNDKTP
jgi:ABC-type glycerol-3-phosphate transport system substrate-binding protein